MADTRGAFLGAGKIYLADAETPGNLIFIGNCSSLSYEAETQDIELQDYTTPGGGLDASVQRVSAVSISYNARHFNKANIARALYGTTTDVDAGTVADEQHTAYPGALVALKYPGATDVVIKTTETVPVTLELDTDYIINSAGFPEILEGGAISVATEVEVSYSYAAHADIQTLTASGKRFRMVFIGLNEARSGKPVVVEAFKVSHSPASLGLIGDDFGGMEFSAKVEKDTSVVGAGLSQFMAIKDVD